MNRLFSVLRPVGRRYMSNSVNVWEQTPRQQVPKMPVEFVKEHPAYTGTAAVCTAAFIAYYGLYQSFQVSCYLAEMMNPVTSPLLKSTKTKPRKPKRKVKKEKK